MEYDITNKTSSQSSDHSSNKRQAGAANDGDNGIGTNDNSCARTGNEREVGNSLRDSLLLLSFDDIAYCFNHST